ncbi:MAG: FAD:protein FMN transferase [Bacteroidota bacterium]
MINSRNIQRVFVAAIALSLCGCKGGGDDPIVREGVAMNTYVTISVYGSSLSPGETQGAIDKAFREIDRIEQMATDYSDTSEVGRINLNAGIDSISVSHELVELLHASLGYGVASFHAFAVTVGPIVKEWDFLSEHPGIPERSRIDSLLPLVNDALVSIVDSTVFLQRKGMALDLGAIAKGYAVDRAIDLLKSHGVTKAIVDIGGNLGVVWEGTNMLDSTAASIYIRHPRREAEFFGSFLMGEGGVSTSGDYQRYFMNDGNRYHHIIDPSTGYPVQGIISVTIIASDAMTADALSTVVFVLGKDRGMEFIRNTTGAECLIVYEDRGTLVHVLSPGFKGKFIPTPTP